MIPGSQQHHRANNDICTMFPQMAATLLNCLEPPWADPRGSDREQTCLHSDPRRKVHFFRLPNLQLRGQKPVPGKNRPVRANIASSAPRRRESMVRLRGLVRHISHAYNNNLMGILGYVTLINLECKNHPDLQDAGQRIELLIQTGANLINMMFGYLAERRRIARQLQLEQLFGEFELCTQTGHPRIEIERFKSRMQNLATHQHLSDIIAALARVMEQLLSWIEEEVEPLRVLKPSLPQVSQKLAVIEKLLARGAGIVQDLMFHVGAVQPVLRKVSLRSLIRKNIQRLRIEFPAIHVRSDLKGKCPWVHADHEKLEYAFLQISRNAIEAMKEAGNLIVKVKTLAAESPAERCVVHSLRDYIVVTITDDGEGMNTSTLKRIFEPFFSTKTNATRHFGLGLPAARGIVRAHGGYLQVRSALSRGSCFKIYLPIIRSVGGVD